MQTFSCGNCHHSAAAELDECPSCGAWSFFFPDEPGARVRGVRSLREAKSDTLALIETGTLFDRLRFAVPGAAALFSGNPGVGKSTEALRVLDALSRATKRRSLFLSGEMPAELVAQYAERIGADLDAIDVHECSSWRDVSALALGSYVAIVVDSVHALAVRGLASVPLKDLKRKAPDAVRIGIARVNKSGRTEGANELEHAVDVTVHIQARRIVTKKTRFGACTAITRESGDRPEVAAKSPGLSRSLRRVK